MTRLFVVIFILLISHQAFGQTILVRDKQNLQPLELVTIFSNNPSHSTVTNRTGQTSINEFSGLDSIYFRLIGYETLLLSYNEIKKLDFEVLMNQSEMSLDEVVVSATKWKQGRRETP